jgi:hypothetical protein
LAGSLGPIDLHCSSKTVPNKARKPDGNSTKQLARPTHVARRELPVARAGKKLAGTMRMCTLDVTGVGSFPWRRTLEFTECQLAAGKATWSSRKKQER